MVRVPKAPDPVTRRMGGLDRYESMREKECWIMRTKMIHFWKRGMALLLALTLCISLLPGMATTAEAKASPKSKTVSATIKFYNHTGKRITELYFEDSKADDYGEEYLATRNFKYWSNKKYIMVPLKFKKSVSLDFFIRYSDGSGYEAKGLKLAKATAKNSVIDLTKSGVTLKVKNKKVASAKFVKAEDEGDDDDDEGVRVTGVRLNKSSTTVTEGKSVYLTATVSPSGATNKSVRWTSSDSSVATVSSGMVTGKKAGTVTIIATTADGGYSASCRVTVTAKKIPAVSVTLNQSSLSLSVGDTSNLTATVNPSGANQKVSWHSSNTSVVSVSSTGKVTGKKAGTATVYATTADGGYVATCKVTVTAKKVSVTSVKLNKTSLSLSVGSTSYLTKTVYPSGATSKTVKWSSSDPSVATVSSSGKVTGVKAGTATITVTTVDGGYTASCKVTVTAKTISKTIYFKNSTGKQIDELYFVESGSSSWEEEYLGTRQIRYWTAGKLLAVPMKFTTDASLDFYIRCSDGSEYEARGLSLEKAGTTGARIELTVSKVNLLVNNVAVTSTAMEQKKAPTEEVTALSDAEWAALQNNWDALKKAYNAVADVYNNDQIKANKDIEAAMKEAKSLIEQMGAIKREGLSAADGKKLLEAMQLTADALDKILNAMEVIPQTRTINVKFINGTTVDFTNFSAKPQGGTGSTPVTLNKEFGEKTLQFTVADTVSAFEITFTESANNQPYTMTVTFDSSVKDGDTLTVQFNVDEQTQQIVYSQI